MRDAISRKPRIRFWWFFAQSCILMKTKILQEDFWKNSRSRDLGQKWLIFALFWPFWPFSIKNTLHVGHMVSGCFWPFSSCFWQSNGDNSEFDLSQRRETTALRTCYKFHSNIVHKSMIMAFWTKCIFRHEKPQYGNLMCQMSKGTYFNVFVLVFLLFISIFNTDMH